MIDFQNIQKYVYFSIKKRICGMVVNETSLDPSKFK